MNDETVVGSESGESTIPFVLNFCAFWGDILEGEGDEVQIHIFPCQKKFKISPGNIYFWGRLPRSIEDKNREISKNSPFFAKDFPDTKIFIMRKKKPEIWKN